MRKMLSSRLNTLFYGSIALSVDHLQGYLSALSYILHAFPIPFHYRYV